MNAAITTFSRDDYFGRCNNLAAHDKDLQSILDLYGYPPLWSRPNSYETVVHIILEQQVSLASAKASLEKLRSKIKNITPEHVVGLSDQALKETYISRQKARYIKALAAQLISGELVLTELATLPDEEIRAKLLAVPGIGNWTVAIYLMTVLHRLDVFPSGDLAVIQALRQLKQLPNTVSREQIQETIAANWRPQRTIATMLLWHYYLSLRTNRSA